MYAIGKAVYHRFTDSIYGSWMRDPGPAQMEFGEATIWTTNETDPGHLYEFYNKTTYRMNIYVRKYELSHHFMVSFGFDVFFLWTLKRDEQIDVFLNDLVY